MNNLYKFATKDGNVKVIAPDKDEAIKIFKEQAPNKVYTVVQLIKKDIK
jgi:hypothetical protein